MNRTVSVALTMCVLAAVTAAPASATPPTREVVDFSGEELVDDVCAFPLLFEDEGRAIITTHYDNTGVPVRQQEVYPGTRSTVTNVDTGESYSLTFIGPHLVTFDPDGSYVRTGTGPWIWGVVHPTTDERGLFVLHGRWQMAVDAEGNAEMLGFTGSSINLCELLA